MAKAVNAVVAFFVLLGAVRLDAQSVSQRGFAEGRLFFYPQTTTTDTARGVGEASFRYEPTVRPASWLRIAAGFDARFDTHDQVERTWRLDWSDRGVERPAFSIRRLSAAVNRGPFSLEAGKQFIRWGKADILNPTDRFAPRDYLTVVDSDFLGVTGARAIYERGSETVDLVWVPRFTPSRTPLLKQRWTVLPPLLAGHFFIADHGAVFPKRSEFGARWNHNASGYEFSLSFYDGFDHLPLFLTIPSVMLGRIDLIRTYPQMRMYGGDAAVPLRWFIVKGEVGYFTSRTREAAEYGIYVIQLERQVGEWHLVGGYAGDFVTREAPVFIGAGIPLDSKQLDQGQFSPERGLARSFVGRVGYTIDANRELVVETAVRETGRGSWLKGQYSQAAGNHVRATVEGNWIRGRSDDFLGQYARNSNINLTLRCSF